MYFVLLRNPKLCFAKFKMNRTNAYVFVRRTYPNAGRVAISHTTHKHKKNNACTLSFFLYAFDNTNV